jgi:hypothetical protein
MSELYISQVIAVVDFHENIVTKQNGIIQNLLRFSIGKHNR